MLVERTDGLGRDQHGNGGRSWVLAAGLSPAAGVAAPGGSGEGVVGRVEAKVRELRGAQPG